MLSVHYRLLTMAHQSKTENLDWYVMPYLEYCKYVMGISLVEKVKNIFVTIVMQQNRY